MKTVVAAVCLGLLGWGLLWLAPALWVESSGPDGHHLVQRTNSSSIPGSSDATSLIQVARPHKPSSAKVPAIYVLDGDTRFGEVADMAGEFADTGDIAPAYVIGIAYPDQTAEAWRTLRERDLCTWRGRGARRECGRVRRGGEVPDVHHPGGCGR